MTWYKLQKMLRAFPFLKLLMRASLMVQWLRIHLPMQGTWVWFLFQDPTCLRASKPICHNYRVHAPQAHAPQEKPQQWEALPPWQGVALLAVPKAGLRTATKTQLSQKLINLLLKKKSNITLISQAEVIIMRKLEPANQSRWVLWVPQTNKRERKGTRKRTGKKL